MNARATTALAGPEWAHAAQDAWSRRLVLFEKAMA
jgi:hypothetical protein